MVRWVSAATLLRGIAMMFEEGTGGIRKAAGAASEIKKKISSTRFSSDLIIKRNSTTTAGLAEEEGREFHTLSGNAGLGSLQNKSLYLCFEETGFGCSRVSHSIETVRLSHVLAAHHTGDDEDEEEQKNILELETLAYRSGPIKDVPNHASSTLVGGSKIVFSSGDLYRNLSHAYGFEIPKDPTVHAYEGFKPLPVIKNSEFLVEVDGKLYILGQVLKDKPCHCSLSVFFEVFDDKDGEGKWLPLDVPATDPIIDYPKVLTISFSCAVAGTNILIWATHYHPGVGVYRFDVTHPEKGWTQLDFDVGSCITSLGYAEKLFLKLHPDRDTDRDRGFLMFSYKPGYPENILQVFLMSHDCDSLKPMEPVPLPELVLEFCEQGGHIFHIEGQKVGLALFRPEWLSDDYYEKVRVAVMTFEYEVITTDGDHEAFDVKYKLLSTCLLDYDNTFYPYLELRVLGAYVL
ncbi:hypothetical protein M0R45_018538 [Rubus argutus]|uniref:Uncharacterized protein n=1 Tax=Rubus argutus TaxID=59490 RepID=A0AAW1X458_RUBAR